VHHRLGHLVDAAGWARRGRVVPDDLARAQAHQGNRVARGGASFEVRGLQLLELSPESEGRVVALLADLFEAALRSRSGGLTGPPSSRSPLSTTEKDP